MKREMSMEFCRVTEAAALASYHWLGRGDKNAADDAAVHAMRYMLNGIKMNGEIVIGEGEIDEAPMLYIGEAVGEGGEGIDIAVDPIDGTRMTALGQVNAVAVLAACDKGGFLKVPDMYMEKLMVGAGAKGVIDLNRSLLENIASISKVLGKPYSDITCVTLAKPRHEAVIKMMHEMGLKVYAFPDGDVAASILTCMPDNDIDFLYCIGGAPEGVISAAAVRALRRTRMSHCIRISTTIMTKSLSRERVSGHILSGSGCAEPPTFLQSYLKRRFRMESPLFLCLYCSFLCV